MSDQEAPQAEQIRSLLQRVDTLEKRVYPLLDALESVEQRGLGALKLIRMMMPRRQ